MHSETSDCESIRIRLSASADAHETLPDSVRDHLRECPDCRAFDAFLNGPVPQQLAAGLSPAGIELRRKILALPQQGTRDAIPAPRPAAAWRRVRQIVSSVAAVLLVSLLVSSLLRPPPPARTVRTPSPLSHALAAEKELAALDKDVQQGLAGLRVPVRSLRTLLNP